MMANLIEATRNFLTSPQMMEMYEKPGFQKWAVAGFIVANMVTWPTFIMMDKKTPKNERQYAAERQFFQEVMALIAHLSVTSSLERAGHFLGAQLYPKEFLVPDPRNAGKMLDLRNWKDYRHAIDVHNPAIHKLIKAGQTEARDQLIHIPPVVRGSMRAGGIFGYITTMHVVAPWLNNMLLPTFLKGINGALKVATGGKLALPTTADRAKGAIEANAAPQAPPLEFPDTLMKHGSLNQVSAVSVVAAPWLAAHVNSSPAVRPLNATTGVLSSPWQSLTTLTGAPQPYGRPGSPVQLTR
jgi:hypothetical protein